MSIKAGHFFRGLIVFMSCFNFCLLSHKRARCNSRQGRSYFFCYVAVFYVFSYKG